MWSWSWVLCEWGEKGGQGQGWNGSSKEKRGGEFVRTRPQFSRFPHPAPWTASAWHWGHTPGTAEHLPTATLEGRQACVPLPIPQPPVTALRWKPHYSQKEAGPAQLDPPGPALSAGPK